MKNPMMRLNANRNAPVSVEGDVIQGCSLVTVGEALGHGVQLDASFVKDCYEQATKLKMGLKSRFGHPSMCNEALGTYLGRFKNFSLSEDGTQLFGDLHIAASSHKSPHGDIGAYVTQLAKDDPEAFGTSIVFAVGGYYAFDDEGEQHEVDPFDYDGVDEKPFVKLGKLHDCDFVDEPAANPNGLFSATSVAGTLNQFFSKHPEVKALLEKNENVVDIIQKYGVNIRQYLSQGIIMTEPEDIQDEALELNSDISDEICPESDETQEVEVETEEEIEVEAVEAMSASDYRDLVKSFGIEIADKVFASANPFNDATALQNDELGKANKLLSETNAALEAKILELNAKVSEYESDGVSFQGEPGKPEVKGRARVIAAFKNNQ